MKIAPEIKRLIVGAAIAIFLVVSVIAFFALHAFAADDDTKLLSLFIEEKQVELRMADMQKQYVELQKKKAKVEADIKAIMDKREKADKK